MVRLACLPAGSDLIRAPPPPDAPPQSHLTIEHLLRVSPTTYRPLSAGADGVGIRTHPFSAQTHRHAREAVPAVVFSYDLSPLQLLISEERPPLSKLLISACAIVGGVFSSFNLLDGALHSSARALDVKI